VTAPVLEIAGLVKDYRGLRPLRMTRLTLSPGEQIAVLGFDAPAAEMFTTLVTGALNPDEGTIHLLGLSTASLQNSDEWLRLVDRIGIITERVVLLDSMTVIQNLALPFTLTLEPPPDDARLRAESLAVEAGLPPSVWATAVGDLDGGLRTRVRLARAIAFDPALVLLEHPTARVDRSAVQGLGRDIRTVADRRGIATLTLTADQEFARAVARVVVTWSPADGGLRVPRRAWWASRG
jgi:ABC-type transporter Mla maintaining outer membrane lipid asymmetry ATPase subunit MlaF